MDSGSLSENPWKSIAVLGQAPGKRRIRARAGKWNSIFKLQIFKVQSCMNAGEKLLVWIRNEEEYDDHCPY